jgi:hypothetical protein
MDHRSMARLLIHAEHAEAPSRGHFVALLRPWRAWVASLLGQAPSAHADVHVDDLGGQQFYAAEDAQSLLEVPLPAGTYHVNIRLGDAKRRYTVTLEHGSTVNLYLDRSAGFQ